MDKENIIEAGANVTGAIVSTSMASISPPMALLGTIIGPVVTAVTSDVANRALSRSESDRVNGVTQYMFDKVEKRLNDGDQPRRDDVFYLRDEYNQSSAEKLLEETLLRTKQEFEAKKLEYYGNFYANICFENNVSYETANSIIGLFSSLSHQQVKILAYLNTGKTIPLDKWEKEMYIDDRLAPYYMFFSDCLHLYSIRLASNPTMKLGVPEIHISHSGKLMCKLLEIVMTEQELREIESQVIYIEKIVEGLKTTK